MPHQPPCDQRRQALRNEYIARINRAIARETLNRFIQRVRVEKAASQLINNPKKTITEITAEDKLRISVCITVSADTSVDGDVGKMTIPGGQYAVARFELTGSGQYENTWDTVMGGWLPESGYLPDDRICYEIYHNNPKEHPQGIHIVDICVPVKPL